MRAGRLCQLSSWFVTKTSKTWCDRYETYGIARRKRERTGQWWELVFHTLVVGTTLLVVWRLSPWAVLYGLRCSGRCSSWRRLPFRTVRQQHTSRRSWRNRMMHWTRSSFGADLDINSHAKGVLGHGFSHFRNRQRLRIDWFWRKLMPVGCKKSFCAPQHSQDGPTVKFRNGPINRDLRVDTTAGTYNDNIGMAMLNTKKPWTYQK